MLQEALSLPTGVLGLAGYMLDTPHCIVQVAELVCVSILTLQMEPEGVAVLRVQRLDISPAGLLKLKLFQAAGNLLLQSLQVRQSSEVSLCTKHTPLFVTVTSPDFYVLFLCKS